MNDRQQYTLDVLRAVQEFCIAHPIGSPPPLYAATIADLRTEIAELERQASEQTSGNAMAQSASTSRRSLLRTLREDYMVPLRKLSQALLGDIPGIREQFRVPYLGANRGNVVAAARSMVQHSAPFAELFVAHGRPQDFMGRMQALIEAITAAGETRLNSLRRRIGATTGVKVALMRAKKSVRFLDVMYRYAYASDPQVLDEWQRVKRFEPRQVVKGPISGPAPVTGVPAGSAQAGSTPAAGVPGSTPSSSVTAATAAPAPGARQAE